MAWRAGRLRFAFAVVGCLAAASRLEAGGGGRNVLVIANDNSEQSLEIANYYARARGLPAANVCRIRTTSALTTDKATYQAEIETPIETCITNSPYANRIDYIVLTRGLPIVAAFPGGDVSLAALLQAMDTTLRGKDQEYAGPLYGFQNYPNPYKNRDIAFTHKQVFGGHKLRLATMLSGYWPSDGTALVDRSLASDNNPPTLAPGAEFFLEDAAGGAADVRNVDFPQAVTNLASRGFVANHVLHSDPNVQGRVVASHVSAGTYSAIGKADIDANTYPPGSIVCALESFGLTPNNFTPGMADQTPVTWWVSAGVTGAHGTVSEPYNVAFPDGFVLEPWVDGYNLAETFYQGIPYLYWMNLVLGDALAAPYAIRPVVVMESPAAGATVSGFTTLTASATTTRPGGIALLELFVGDLLVTSGGGPRASASFDTARLSDGWHRFETVAYDASKFTTQSTGGIDFRVDNLGLSATITAPPMAAAVASVFPVTIEAPGAASVRLFAGTLDLGQSLVGSPFVIDVDSALLGRGRNALTAVATYATGNARSARHDVYVVKAPRVTAFGPPASGPQSGGTAVAVEGYNFEPDVKVWFGGRLGVVSWQDANHLVVTSPTGVAGPVDVRLENPAAQELTLLAVFTYTPSTCPATDPVSPLLAARLADGRVQLSWPAAVDPCWQGFHVFGAIDPALPPVFPGDFSDITASDEDGNPGGDTTFLWTAPAAGLIWLRTAAEGTDGSLGP